MIASKVPGVDVQRGAYSGVDMTSDPDPQTVKNEFYPLVSHAELHARNVIRTFKDRVVWILGPYYENFKGGKTHDTPIAKPKRSVHPVPPFVGYRQMGSLHRCLRTIKNVCTVWGTIPDSWNMMTGTVTSVIMLAMSGVLSSFQGEAVRLENGLESWSDIGNWAYNTLQISVYVTCILFFVFVVNALADAPYTELERLNMKRFRAIMDSYRADDSGIAKYELEYDPKQDADLAMLYFSLRERHWNNRNVRFITKWYERFFLIVHESDAWPDKWMAEIDKYVLKNHVNDKANV